ncbi:hypothetical protein ACUR5C_06515 [Aliikangiella sp. IMCC44653]
MRWCMVICWDAVACGMSDVVNFIGTVGTVGTVGIVGIVGMD